MVSGIRAMFKRDEHSKAVLDVNEVIQEVVELLRGELNSRRVSVRTELSQELPQISADRVQLQQVLHNLVMNAGEAMSAMPDDARVLTISSKHHARNEVIIVVEDSGPGIDPKDMERIFDAFFTTKPQGMGMGLSICRSIIEAHHGQLSRHLVLLRVRSFTWYCRRTHSHNLLKLINPRVMPSEVDRQPPRLVLGEQIGRHRRPGSCS